MVYNQACPQQQDMKTLTVYYSRSGTTRRIAEELVKKLGSDVDPITESRGRGASSASSGQATR